MCGIVGMAGNLNGQTNKMFRDMLIFSQLRGMDSTGVLTVPINDHVAPTLVKEVGPPNNLFEAEPTIFDDKGILKQYPKIIIGHTRAATIGSTTKENAHPFNFGHIYGVHNGSLVSYKDLVGHDEHDVDSQAIFNTIAEKGIDETWKSFYGAACLVYWDANEKKLHIIRNDQRPLVMMQSASKDTFFWASEDWMILAAAGRNRIDLDRGESGKVVMMTPAPNKLYTYTVTSTSFKAEEGRELEKKVYIPPPSTMTYTQTHGFGGYGQGFKGRTEPITEREGRSNYALSKPLGINTTWAHNLQSAPKEIRGTRFKLLTLVDSIDSSGRTFYMVGETVNKERVEVWPTHVREYEQWTRYNGQRKVADLWFEITKRPRIKKWGNVNCYRISTQHVKLMESVVIKKDVEEQKPLPFETVLLYKANGKLVSAAKWREIVYSSSNRGGCTCCGNPLAIEEHEKYTWYGDNCVLCETCAEDPTVVDYVRHYSM